MTTRDPRHAGFRPDPDATAHAEAQAVLDHHLRRQHGLGLLYGFLAYGS